MPEELMIIDDQTAFRIGVNLRCFFDASFIAVEELLGKEMSEKWITNNFNLGGFLEDLTRKEGIAFVKVLSQKETFKVLKRSWEDE